ncbi:metallophosphoesterase [Geomonas sp. RF6]|uniref:metallophosphoesterase n=1 Tax=Geomonas sp. RF6 TaxID=2897342 RepID=UPI001E314A15|nr:metallophosphoesterase [Geomonas sp. RF6]UFS72444.1 metallophosphoesterase [Geomonas sp. RF6]
MTPISRRLFVFGGAPLFPYLYLERLAVAIKRYQIPVVSLPAEFDGFTILHLTDLHDKEFGRDGSELLALLDTEQFDVVALTGDLVVSATSLLTPALRLVEGLKSRPVFAVSGNHEWNSERGEEICEKLRQAGAEVLSNTSHTFRKGAGRLSIVGVDDPVTGRASLRKALSTATGEGPRLLLAHSPQIYEEAVQEKVDVVLAGHTHGGQLRLPVFGAPYVPSMGIFPPYDYGVYSSGKTSMIVNAGLGESLLPVRFNIRPEVVLVSIFRATTPHPHPVPLAPRAEEEMTQRAYSFR